jgi:hypothetical protein
MRARMNAYQAITVVLGRYQTCKVSAMVIVGGKPIRLQNINNLLIALH